MDKKEMASEFRLTLVRHLKELRKNRESHVTTGNTKSIKRYDRMIKNALKNIDKMDRIINGDIGPVKHLEEHKLQ